MFNTKKVILNNPDKEYPANMGAKWEEDESALLLDELKKNIDLDTIAKNHGRTIGGINARLRSIAYNMYLDRKTIDEISEKTKLDILSIEQTIKKRGKKNETKQKTNANENKKYSIENEILEIKNNVNNLKNTVEKMFLMVKTNHEFMTLLVREKIKKISKIVEQQEKDEEIHKSTDSKAMDNLEDCESSENSSDAISSNSLKIYKINGIECIKEDYNYYEFTNDEKGKLIATINDEGEVELIEEEDYEYIAIGKKDYILIDENVYTILEGKPDELYGKYANGKFTKFNNNKIIIKGRKQKEKTDEELEADLKL